MNDDDREDTAALRTYAALLAIILGAMALNTCSVRHAHGQDAEVRPETVVIEEVPTQRPCCDDARPVVTDAIEWNDSTRLALGQCDVAEAGWRNHTEHAAMAFVLLRRWREYNARHPEAPITFEQQIRQYCHVHRVERTESSNGWALGLTWGPLTVDPREATDPRPMCTGDDCWRRYASRWDAVREAVLAFEAGETRDPMPLAVIWGGAMDHGGSAPSLVWLGPTVHSIVNEDGSPVLLVNRFYGRRSAIARRARSVALD